jgi:sodium-dependent dicarboxylate transporter 2/3/5
MLPIARALMAQLEAQRGVRLGRYGAALMLAVACASNVGGVGTKIGTATNSIFCGTVEAKLGISVGFAEFLLIGLPFVVLFIPLIWWRLWTLGRADGLQAAGARASVDEDLRALGPASAAEKRCAAIFLVAAALWIAGDLVRPWIAPHVPEFWRGFEFRSKHYEAWVAMAAGAAVAAAGVLGLRSFVRIPFATLLLLAGSFAMAEGIEGSGLGLWLAASLAGVAGLPLVAQLGIASASTIALSAVASNTATITVMLNVLPRSLPVLATAAIAASCDFALPAGTPPNAIVFGSGYVRLPVMMRAGAVLDLCAAVLITAYGALWLTLVL